MAARLLGHHSAVFATLLGFLSFSLLLPSPVARADCYWPDGSENDSHDPCYSPEDGAEGLCCRSGDACLGNGICESGRDNDRITYYRGSCGSPDWIGIESCPSFCVNGTGGDGFSGETPMFRCPGAANLWYCGDANQKLANCSSGQYILTLPGGTFAYTTIGDGPSSTPAGASSAAALPPSVSSSPALAMGPVSTMPGGVFLSTSFNTVIQTLSVWPSIPTDGLASPVASTTPGPPPPPPVSSSAAPLPQAGQTNAIVPLAVGVSIGSASIVAAGVIALLLWRKCRRDAPARAETPPPQDDDEDHRRILGVEQYPGSMMFPGDFNHHRYPTPGAASMRSTRPGWEHGDGVPLYDYR